MRINEVLTPLEEGVDDQHIFKAIFLAGGPGSGKSYVSNILTGMAQRKTGLKVVNSDDIYEFLMSKAGLELSPENVWSDEGQETRARAKSLVTSREQKYLEGRLGLILDGTGKDVQKIAAQKEKLESLGYECIMLFINTSEDIAIQRDAQRDRSVGSEAVSKMWRKVQDNIMKFQQVFGAANFHVVDNSGGLEDPSRKENFDQVSKNIDKFINTPPRNRIARQWIQDAKAAKART